NTLDFGFEAVPPNTPPTITAGSTISYTEQQPSPASVVIEPGILVADDDHLIDSATVVISSGFFAGDVLSFDTAFASAHSISGGYAGGTLSFTGTASDTDYQTLLQSVSFSSTSDNPTNFGNAANTSRTVTWTVNDGTQNNS